MEHYLSHTDYLIWKVIQNGNGSVSVTTDTNGMIKVLPPKTTEEVVARERERKARTTLLMALPEDHLAKFHKMADAKEMWEAIKSRFEVLRSLPSSWSQVALIMRTKPRLDTLSFDDLYNNLRVFERDVTTASSSSNTHKVAFVSVDNTSNTNDVSTAYTVSLPSVSKSHKEGSSLYTDEVAMISIRIKKFYKRTDRKLQFDTKDPVGFDKTKVKCFNCHKMRHFARDCREDIDWSGHVEDDTQNYAMIAYSSSNSGSDNKTLVDESDAKNCKNAFCEFDSSVETTTSMHALVENAPKVVCDPKVWTDAHIFKEYESDSDDDLVSNV
uniref:Ribonuclease H-like domain-containing protein n=1 Tax=Tanacetum cinerariifolium TaxID=118510 RepID=A0A6L2LGJ7_TANCI|nr:ribonuclease H-like domain-containing protein [Tanacetum cinerariifolium]